MKRSELRETIFKLLFMAQFNSPAEMPEQLKLYFESLEQGREDALYAKPGEYRDCRSWDVNSLYPSIMRDAPMPVGSPISVSYTHLITISQEIWKGW